MSMTFWVAIAAASLMSILGAIRVAKRIVANPAGLRLRNIDARDQFLIALYALMSLALVITVLYGVGYSVGKERALQDNHTDAAALIR